MQLGTPPEFVVASIQIVTRIIPKHLPPMMIYYATTNQKQAFTTEEGMKERCDEREAQGKHYAIVLGALLVDRQLKI